MNKKIKAIANKCPGCGDDMVFNPEKNCLFCPSCKSQKEIVEKFGLAKHNLNDSKEMISHKNQEWASQMQSMQCPNCGAISTLQNYQTAAICPYCSTSLIASDKETSSLKPDGVIPFKFGKEKAEELFKTKLANKWFISNKFKKSINADEIVAYYIPSFVFDAECNSTYTGKLYRNETTRDKNGSTSTSRHYFRISGQKHTSHNNVAIEASTQLTQDELNSIKPYNFKEARVYSDEYIYGYSLENYSNSLKETNQQAREIIKRDIQRDILSEYHYDGISSFEMQTSYLNENYSYCILPVYRINFKHKDKKYSNIMNGQTGSLHGNYPKSGWKMTLTVLLITLIVLLPMIAFVFAIISHI